MVIVVAIVVGGILADKVIGWRYNQQQERERDENPHRWRGSDLPPV